MGEISGLVGRGLIKNEEMGIVTALRCAAGLVVALGSLEVAYPLR